MYERNKVWIWVYVGFAILAVGPVIISLIANSGADALGCQITAAGTNCPLPDLFYDAGELYWFSFFTFPAGVVGIIITGIAHAVTVIRRRRSTTV
jgi:hypothetical protein